ncbi:MAG: hypothetical protein JWO98_5335 [Frankiales bacterium]|nr:hypothetical protein [Frankiales bacterium]
MEDIESDLSTFHRIDDVLAMRADDFISKAQRLVAYRGVMRERAIARQHEEENGTTDYHAPSYSTPSEKPKEVKSDRASLEADPVLRDLIDWG